MTIAEQKQNLQQEWDDLETEFEYLSGAACPTTHGLEATLWAEEVSTNRLRQQDVEREMAAISVSSPLVNALEVPSVASERADTIHKMLRMFGVKNPSPELIQAIAELTCIDEANNNSNSNLSGEDFWTKVLPRMVQSDSIKELPTKLRDFIEECERRSDEDDSDEDYS